MRGLTHRALSGSRALTPVSALVFCRVSYMIGTMNTDTSPLAPDVQIIDIDSDAIRPDDENANLGTERGRQMLARSMATLKAGRSVLLDRRGVVLAGNKTLEAARAAGVAEVVIVRTTGDQLVAVQREDLDLSSPDESGDKARQMAYADNRVAQVSLKFDPKQIVKDVTAGVVLDDFFTPMELAELGELADAVDETDLENMFAGMDEEATPVSSGELLALVDITIGEPRHQVHRGEVYELHAPVNDGRVVHTLVVGDVISGWQGWVGYLKPGALFAPHPGPFVPLSLRSEKHPMVLVQPSLYIAGHLLDRFEDVHGAKAIRKIKAAGDD